MKYFIIAGEASGDLHASHLAAALLRQDSAAEIRFYGGDMLAAATGMQPVVHYRDMAYMGFVEVAKHLPAILGFLRTAKRMIDDWRPDAVILVDYPSFNLKVAKHAHERGIAVHYFISPKVWVWKQWRVRDIKRTVDAMYCILPFEPQWYATRGYHATYVGNPTVAEVAQARAGFASREEFLARHDISDHAPLVAIVPGSRVKEIRDNLPVMLEATAAHDCVPVIAAAPGMDHAVYDTVLGGRDVPLVTGCTMELVSHARVALVTSGTATLETAVLGTPQVACYRMNGSRMLHWFYRQLLSGKYVTLPNLIADEPVIPELLLHHCTAAAIADRLGALLIDSDTRRAQLAGYATVMQRLGTSDAATQAATLITTPRGENEK